MKKKKLKSIKIQRLFYLQNKYIFYCILLNIFLIISSTCCPASQLIHGKISDGVSELPVSGASIEIYKRGDKLGKAFSDIDGYFSVSFDLKANQKPQVLTLTIEHEKYAKLSSNIQMVSGKPDQKSYLFSLLPSELTTCRLIKGPSVTIGHFRSPISSDYSELSYRISDTLTYDLLTRLQQLHLNPLLQPTFLACDEANPRGANQAKNFAKVLNTDAFLFGNVKKATKGHDVRIFVIDKYDLFLIPISLYNKGIDLDDPASSQLDSKTHAAILTSIAVGYERNNNFSYCVDATTAAENILGELTPLLLKVRKRCQEKLDHNKLLIGGN